MSRRTDGPGVHRCSASLARRRTAPTCGLAKHTQSNTATARKSGFGDVDLEFVGEVALGVEGLSNQRAPRLIVQRHDEAIADVLAAGTVGNPGVRGTRLRSAGLNAYHDSAVVALPLPMKSRVGRELRDARQK